MIDNLNVKYNIPFLIPEQYNDAMSYQELLYSILNSVNNCIDAVNKLPDNVRAEVIKQLNVMISDGTIADLINDTIFNELNRKINDLTEKTTNNTNAIAKNSNDISALQSSTAAAITKNSNDITALETSMSSASENIERNTSDINNVKSKQTATLSASSGCTVQSQSLSKINNIAICSFILVTTNQVTANTVFATLPTNFRPKSTMYFTMSKAGSTECINGQVATDGTIKSPNINLASNSYYTALIVYTTI